MPSIDILVKKLEDETWKAKLADGPPNVYAYGATKAEVVGRLICSMPNHFGISIQKES